VLPHNFVCGQTVKFENILINQHKILFLEDFLFVSGGELRASEKEFRGVH
jgi:hypothetical protein